MIATIMRVVTKKIILVNRLIELSGLKHLSENFMFEERIWNDYDENGKKIKQTQNLLTMRFQLTKVILQHCLKAAVKNGNLRDNSYHSSQSQMLHVSPQLKPHFSSLFEMIFVKLGKIFSIV